MSFLFSLPCDLLSELVSEWLFMSSVVRLDTASTSVRLRKVYLTSLREIVPIDNESNSLSLYIWLHKRGLRFRNLYINFKTYNFSKGKLEFPCDLSCIERLSFTEMLQPSSALEIIEQCRVLKVLEVDYSNLIINFSSEVLQKLPGLCLNINKFELISVMEKLLLCQSLTTLELRVRLDVSFCDFLENLLINNPLLKSIELRCSHNFLPVLLKHCNHMESIALENISNESSVAVLRDLMRSRHLSKLNFLDPNLIIEYDSKKGLFKVRNSKATTKEICSLIDAVRTIATADFDGISSECDSLVPFLSKFSSTLKGFCLSNSILSIDALRALIIKSSTLMDLSLWILGEDQEILDVFSHVNAKSLTRLHLTFENGVQMKTVCALFQGLPLLVDFSFEVVFSNDDAVEDFRFMVMDRYWSNRNLVGHVDFISDRVLEFGNGMFGGKSVFDYLTYEEREYWKWNES